MDLTVGIIISCVVGYLLGSANSSLIVGKFYGTDVRKHGSGNAGATNTLRTLGKTAALFVTLGDVLKGIIACLIGNAVCGKGGLIAAGIAAIIGHNWPLYFKFKGGKGVLTTFAVVIMMDWQVAIALLCVFIFTVAVTRYISLGSVLSAFLFPFGAYLSDGNNSVYIVSSIILAALVIIRHRSNIVRICKGTESKFGAKKNA